MSACGLAIFVKTPRLSAVKTRLWPMLGRARAETLYIACAEAVQSVAMQCAQGHAIAPHFALAEPADPAHARWSEFPHVMQGDGGLGERMAHVYSAARQRHHGVLLIGADAPQIQADVLAQAATWLDAPVPRLVMGRASDGGFWLFGGNVSLPDAAWKRVEYSRADTAARFIDAFRDCGEWMSLPTLTDLDTGDDIPRVHDQLLDLPAPTSAQVRVRDALAIASNAPDPCVEQA